MQPNSRHSMPAVMMADGSENPRFARPPARPPAAMSRAAVGSPVPKRILILTGGSLAWNPRVLREARTLASAAFEVSVLGSSATELAFDLDCALARECGFTFRSVVPPPEAGPTSAVGSAGRRLRARLGRDFFRCTGLANRWQLGTVVPELLARAVATPADYYIAHTEQGLWAAARLLDAGRGVAVDMEDWHSEDLLPEARKARPLAMLHALERSLLRTGTHATAPSRSMSEALAREFGCARPTVLYNVERWIEREAMDGLRRDRRDPALPSIVWYSQTLGPGRGLEDLLAALPHMRHDAEIHLRGTPAAGFVERLRMQLPERWRPRVTVHGVVPARELLSRVAEHDIGFAGEVTGIRSRDLTVTNKIMSYLLGGLAVVASDTAGQREVAAQAEGAVLLYPSGDAAALAATLDVLLANRERLAAGRAAALQAAQRTFCWERQEERLVALVAQAISGRPSEHSVAT